MTTARAPSAGACTSCFSYDSIHIARSSSFVVDRYGIVRYARLARHQMDHAPLDDILAAAGSPDPQ